MAAERRNKGYTLLHAQTGAPIARLRPIGRDDQMEILYWSLWKQHWAPVGAVAPLDKALRIIASEPIFWLLNRGPPKMCKVELSYVTIYKSHSTSTRRLRTLMGGLRINAE